MELPDNLVQLAGIALILWWAFRTKQGVADINAAVNKVPEGEPTLVQMVREIHKAHAADQAELKRMRDSWKRMKQALEELAPELVRRSEKIKERREAAMDDTDRT